MSYKATLISPTSFCPGLTGGSDHKASACNAGDRVQSLGREDPLEKEVAIHSSIIA